VSEVSSAAAGATLAWSRRPGRLRCAVGGGLVGLVLLAAAVAPWV